MSDCPENFLFIIGSPKAGTTSLARWLDQRDDMVLGAVKEPRYHTDFARQSWHGPGSEDFNTTLLRDEAAYLANYAQPATGKPVRRGAWAIDGSTDYLWCQAAADNIKTFAQNRPSKVICILRDPVERALSEYNHTLRDRMEDMDLPGAMAAEPERMANGWQPLFYHKRRSTCLADLGRYHALFGQDLLILGFHEFKNPQQLLSTVHNFLGLSGDVVSPSGVENQSVLPRNSFWNEIFRNSVIKSIGRRLLAPGMRNSIKTHTHKPAKQMHTTGPQDVALLRDILADEIAACRASSLVDTDHWTTALKP